MNLTIDDLKEYLNVSFNADDKLLNLILKASKNYVKSYTGLIESDLDNNNSFDIAILILGSEMYENRSFTVQNDKVNKVIQSILDMHSVNLI